MALKERRSGSLAAHSHRTASLQHINSSNLITSSMGLLMRSGTERAELHLIQKDSAMSIVQQSLPSIIGLRNCATSHSDHSALINKCLGITDHGSPKPSTTNRDLDS